MLILYHIKFPHDFCLLHIANYIWKFVMPNGNLSTYVALLSKLLVIAAVMKGASLTTRSNLGSMSWTLDLLGDRGSNLLTLG